MVCGGAITESGSLPVLGSIHEKNAEQTGCTERRDLVSVDNQTSLPLRR
jgi:hypothetical protein